MPYVYYCLDNFFQVWVGSKVFIFRFGLSARCSYSGLGWVQGVHIQVWVGCKVFIFKFGFGPRCSYSGLGWVQGVHIQVWVGSKVFIFSEVFIVVLTKVLSRLKI